jgi:hypothetical protein
MTYDDWNDLIAGHFFRPDRAGQRVRLNVTREMLGRLGEANGVGSDDFLQACREGSRLCFPHQPFNVCDHARALRGFWRERNKTTEPLKYPPWIAYLGLFVLAVGVGHHSANVYHQRLWECLGVPGRTDMYPGFQQMQELWKALEHWANVAKHGELGTFRALPLGGMQHVSLPVGQAIWTEEERDELPQLFAGCGFAPGTGVSRGQLRAAVLQSGRGLLCERTLHVLEDGGELAEDLLDEIEETLQNWDGTYVAQVEIGKQEAQRHRRLSGRRLTLFLRQDGTRACVQARFYGLPPDGVLEEDGAPAFVLRKTQGAGPERLLARGLVGWSAPLTTEAGAPFDAAQLDWRTEHCWRSDGGPSRLCLPGAGLRLFVPATRHDLRGWMEANELPYAGRCLVAASKGELGQVQSWLGLLVAEAWKCLPLTGLPTGWDLFRIDSVPASPDVRNAFPGATQPPEIQLRRQGGIKVGSGNSRIYFDFAPPRFLVEGNPDGVSVTVCGQQLTPGGEDRLLSLPGGLKPGPVEVVAGRDGQELARERIYLQTDVWSGNPTRIAQALGPDGLAPTTDGRGAAGGWVEGSEGSLFDFSRLLAESDNQQIYLIGAEPGQIASRPQEPLPAWQPVWVVRLGKRPRIALAGAGPVPPRAAPGASPAAVRRWRDFLYHNRRKLALPAQDPLRPLWDDYQRQARHG